MSGKGNIFGILAFADGFVKVYRCFEVHQSQRVVVDLAEVVSVVVVIVAAVVAGSCLT